MKYNKPQNLKDMLELQKVLDSSINSARERTLEDIKMSMIAEIVEFNEETKNSHKTWKTKEYNKDKELEELTDVWFFMCQMINFKYSTNENVLLEVDSLMTCNKKEQQIFNVNELDLIKMIADIDGNFLIFKYTVMLTRNLNYTYNDILDSYWKKWQVNMNRIGGEWN